MLSSDYGHYPPLEGNRPPREAYLSELPGFEKHVGILVNELGQFYSCRRLAPGGVPVWRPLRIRLGHPTYKRDGKRYWHVGLVTLNSGGNTRTYVACRKLVALAFLGPKPPDHRLCTKDYDTHNHRLDNLAYIHKDHLPAFSKGGAIYVPPTRRQGEGNCKAKLTDALVIELRRAAHDGEHSSVLARRHNMTNANMRKVLNGKFWDHVDAGVPLWKGEVRPKQRGRKTRLRPEEVEAIRSQLRAGHSPRSVWKLYRDRVSDHTIRLWARKYKRE